MTETGAPRPARHLCTGITHLTAWRSRGESLGLHRKGEEANAAQTGGFLFKASWSGFILQEFFYLSEFGQQSPQQVLTGTTSWRSRKALVSFNCQNVFFLISKSSFCYVGRGTAEVPTFRKLMRPLESEPTNPTVGFPGVESRAVTIWQFFRGKKKVFFFKKILYIFNVVLAHYSPQYLKDEELIIYMIGDYSNKYIDIISTPFNLILS